MAIQESKTVLRQQPIESVDMKTGKVSYPLRICLVTESVNSEGKKSVLIANYGSHASMAPDLKQAIADAARRNKTNPMNIELSLVRGEEVHL